MGPDHAKLLVRYLFLLVGTELNSDARGDAFYIHGVPRISATGRQSRTGQLKPSSAAMLAKALYLLDDRQFAQRFREPTKHLDDGRISENAESASPLLNDGDSNRRRQPPGTRRSSRRILRQLRDRDIAPASAIAAERDLPASRNGKELLYSSQSSGPPAQSRRSSVTPMRARAIFLPSHQSNLLPNIPRILGLAMRSAAISVRHLRISLARLASNVDAFVPMYPRVSETNPRCRGAGVTDRSTVVNFTKAFHSPLPCRRRRGYAHLPSPVCTRRPPKIGQ